MSSNELINIIYDTIKNQNDKMSGPCATIIAQVNAYKTNKKLKQKRKRIHEDNKTIVMDFLIFTSG